MRLVGGIDPGKTGALVVLDGEGRPMCVRVMPENVNIGLLAKLQDVLLVFVTAS